MGQYGFGQLNLAAGSGISISRNGAIITITNTASGTTNHGSLTGLDGDDHPQYHNDARGDARYSQLGHAHSHTALTDIGTNTHAQIDSHIVNTSNPHSVTKSQVGLGNVENTALSTWAGSTNITTLGTIDTGTWNATAIGASKGGTGQTGYAVGDILYANTTSSLARLADVATGNVLLSGGIGVAPSWGKVGLTTHVSGTLPVGSGGTGVTALSSILGTTNQVTVSNGTGRVIGGNVTLSLPQNIHTSATPTFASATFNGTVSETTTGADNIRLGVFSGTPRVIFENAGFDQWQIDNDAGNFRWFTPGVVQMRLTTTGLGVGSVTPTNRLTVQGSSTASTLRLINGSGGTGGAYFMSVFDNQSYHSGGVAFESGVWVAKATSASIQAQDGGYHVFYGDTGKTVGASYTPTENYRITPSGHTEQRGFAHLYKNQDYVFSDFTVLKFGGDSFAIYDGNPLELRWSQMDAGFMALMPTDSSGSLLNLRASTVYATTQFIGGSFSGTSGTFSSNVSIGTSAYLDFGSATRAMIRMWGGEQYSQGIQSSTMYFRTGSGFAWYKGGTHNNSQFNAGGGTELARLDTNGQFQATRIKATTALNIPYNSAAEFFPVNNGDIGIGTGTGDYCLFFKANGTRYAFWGNQAP